MNIPDALTLLLKAAVEGDLAALDAIRQRRWSTSEWWIAAADLVTVGVGRFRRARRPCFARSSVPC
jgi:hypothetical protein